MVIRSTLSPHDKRERLRALYEKSRRSFLEVPEVTVEAALTLAASGSPVLFVDARTAEEQTVSTIPGAIAADEVLARPDAYRDLILVAYCTLGRRSGLLAQRLRANRLEVLNLAGGILAWTHAGQPLRNADGPTQRVHVYSRACDLAGEGYLAQW